MVKITDIVLAVLILFCLSIPVQGQECCDHFNFQLGKGEYIQVLTEGIPFLKQVSGKQKFQLLIALGSASFQLGKFVEATEFWRQGIELEPTEYGLRIDLAQAWLNRGNPSNAERILMDLPENKFIGEKYALMGNIAFARDDFSQAISYFEKSLPLLPERWLNAVQRNLVFSYDRQSMQLQALVSEVSQSDRSQILGKIESLQEKLKFYTENSNDLALLIWKWKQGKENKDKANLIAKVKKLPLSLQKGDFLLSLGAFDEARQVAEALGTKDLLVEILISEASSKGSLDVFQLAERIAKLNGDWYSLFQINYRQALINLENGNKNEAERQFKAAYQNLIQFTRLNTLSEERKLYVSQFFNSSIPFFFESNDLESLIFLRSLLKNNQILQVALFYNLPCSIETVNELSQDGKLTLYYFFDKNKGYILSQNNTKMAKVILPFSRTEITNLVVQWRNDLRDVRNSNYKISGQKLYNLLLGSIEFKGVSQIRVVADVILQGIPFAALYDGQQFLIERYPVSYLSRNSAPVVPASGKILAMGSSDFSGKMEPLPFAVREIEDVVYLVGGTALIDQEFTKGNISRQLEKNQYASVHVATHGYFGGNADLSWLQTFDSRLTLTDLSRLLAENSPFDLLVLSGCETSKGNSRIIYGLAGIGLKLGIRSVVASQWSVGDLDASKLMGTFYKSLQGGRSPSEALQASQIEAIGNPAQHPNKWAAFIVLE